MGSIAARPGGLVPCYKSDRNKAANPVTITVYADMVEITVKEGALPGDEQRKNQGGGERTAITDFTHKSRLNMLRQLAKFAKVDDGLFLTLTYPDDFPTKPTRWKRDIATLRKRIARAFPGAGGLWRLEVKERLSGENVGKVAPHFHILLVGHAVKAEQFRVWLRKAWYAVAHDGDKHKGIAGTQCDEVRSRRHAIYYVSKYMSKEGDESALGEGAEVAEMGRYWGVFGDVDMAIFLIVTATIAELVKLKRLIRRHARNQNRKYAQKLARYNRQAGCSVFRLGFDSGQSRVTLWDTTIVRMIEAVIGG